MSRNQIIGLIVALAVAFASGRYLTPTKTITETRIVEVEKKSGSKNTDKEVKKTKTTTTTVVIRPDGTREETTVVVEGYESDTSSKEKEKSETSKSDENRKEVIKTVGRTRISALAGFTPFSITAPVYGAHVSSQLLGPISVGAFGLTSGVVGVSLGLDF